MQSVKILLRGYSLSVLRSKCSSRWCSILPRIKFIRKQACNFWDELVLAPKKITSSVTHSRLDKLSSLCVQSVCKTERNKGKERQQTYTFNFISSPHLLLCLFGFIAPNSLIGTNTNCIITVKKWRGCLCHLLLRIYWLMCVWRQLNCEPLKVWKVLVLCGELW